MKPLIKPESSASRWYSRAGEPRYDANLRHARKDNLVPSVTSILKMWPAYALDAWKQVKIVHAALTLPMLDGETPDAFAVRVVEDAQAEVKDSAQWGIDFHALCEAAHCGHPVTPPERYAQHFKLYDAWRVANVNAFLTSEEIVVNNEVGYAGTLDVHCVMDGRTAVGDIKSRKVKDGKPVFYDTQIMQLKAYGMAMRQEPETYFSVIINREAPEPPYVKVWSREEADDAWGDFLACHNLWQRVNKLSL